MFFPLIIFSCHYHSLTQYITVYMVKRNKSLTNNEAILVSIASSCSISLIFKLLQYTECIVLQVWYFVDDSPLQDWSLLTDELVVIDAFFAVGLNRPRIDHIRIGFVIGRILLLLFFLHLKIGYALHEFFRSHGHSLDLAIKNRSKKDDFVVRLLGGSRCQRVMLSKNRNRKAKSGLPSKVWQIVKWDWLLLPVTASKVSVVSRNLQSVDQWKCSYRSYVKS